MLAVQDVKEALSWHEPTGLHSNMFHYIQICTSTGTYQYVPVRTSMYQYVPMYTGKCTYQYVLVVCTSTYQYILVHTSMYWYVPVCTGIYWFILLVFTLFSGAEGLGCVQDTIVMVPPYPYSITEDIEDVPFTDCWYASTQLLFQCHLRPTGGRPPENWSYKIGPDDLLFNLVFFSTFE
jgi:hypothetical protein